MSNVADMEIYFLRHGETEWNKVHRIQGSTEWTDLTDEGVRLAEATRDGMLASGLSFGRIFSSPYRRALHTAQILGRIVPASHPGQNGIAAGLKSQMELRADFIRFPKFCSEFRRSDSRLQRSEPDTLYTGFRLYNPDRVQKAKRRFHILSVGTEMDSG